ncbi:MAG: hypothetical protein ACI36W_03395 [Coriobacteriales bacterium]
MRKIAKMLAACALCAAVMGTGLAVTAHLGEGSAPQAARVAQASELQQGWDSSKTRYYTDGVAAVGAKKVGSTWRAFNAKGKLQKKSFTLARVTYYCTPKGVLEARKAGGTYYYANGREMSSADAREYKTLLKARAVLTKITKASDSKQVKLRKAFDWVRAKNYQIHRGWSGSKSWPAVYAMDHFSGRGGDCHADAAAFAYLAYAAGYRSVYCCTDSGKTAEDNHGWAQVNGKVYDPLFDESKSGSYFGRSYSAYMTGAPTTKVRVVSISPSHAPKNGDRLSAKSGFKSEGGNLYYYQAGIRTTNSWVEQGGVRYWFRSNGRAARGGSFKTSSGYCVFNDDASLAVGEGTRLLELGDQLYRVAADGAAVSGWSEDGTRCFNERGRLLRGPALVEGVLQVFGGDGSYDAERSAAVEELLPALRAAYEDPASHLDASVSQLLELLGAPAKSEYLRSCNTVARPKTPENPKGRPCGGDDGIWSYPNLTVCTFRADDGAEYLADFE